MVTPTVTQSGGNRTENTASDHRPRKALSVASCKAVRFPQSPTRRGCLASRPYIARSVGFVLGNAPLEVRIDQLIRALPAAGGGVAVGLHHHER